MNNELEQIIVNTEHQLQQLTNEPNPRYIALSTETKQLQKQLLSVSLLNKPNLEQQIKVKLQLLEAEMLAAKDDNRDLELGYLKKYIRETYE